MSGFTKLFIINDMEKLNKRIEKKKIRVINN